MTVWTISGMEPTRIDPFDLSAVRTALARSPPTAPSEAAAPGPPADPYDPRGCAG